ncbi:MAG: alpha-amylase family glycosyl hydrolase [Anaerolineae bacterium]
MTARPKYLWWQTGVIYQIYPRSFKDTTGNGVGDLAGIIQKLDYLTETLRVDAIWLSPFYPSPMADFGYDVADYTDVDPLFGDLATFDELVAQAHRRGLKIIIDLVPSHSSDQHPWFLESRASRDNPKRDWYIWADPKPDGSPPNNWLSVFGGPAWEWDEATEQYYLHSFLKEQPDLNWRNPAVKAAMFNVVDFWLNRGVDGFRIDVAHRIMKDPELRDNPLNTSAGWSIHKPLGEYDSQFHLYDQGHPDVHGVYREFRQFLDAYSAEHPRMAVGEIHIFDWERWASYYGENLDELHMPFNFALLGAEWQAQAVRHVVDSLEAALPAGAWPNYVLGNHDEPRIVSRYGRAQARVAAMLLLTLRGTPTLYYGDEIGMTDVHIPPERQQDPWGLRMPGLGRDPCRTPMQWSPEPNAGFSRPDTPELWLPLAPDYHEVNVERQLADPTSMLSLYRRLLTYRRATPALQWGSYQAVNDVWEGNRKDRPYYVLLRQAGKQRVLVALNFADEEQQVALPALGAGKILVSTQMDREQAVNLAELVLRANEGVIVELDGA